MSGRRGFLALVGGVMVTGAVKATEAARPTLLLPPRIGLRTPPTVGLIEPGSLTGYPRLDAVYAAGETQMHAFIDVKQGLPDELFLDWLEGGLRMVEGCKPGGRIHRAMQADLADGIDP